MRKINVSKIKKIVSELCIQANVSLRGDMLRAFKKGLAKEKKGIARNILKILIENARIARINKLPICQDTGMAVVFVEIGQDVSIVGGDLKTAINQGVREGYKKGYLRKSVVKDPIKRKNTKDNTPAITYFDYVKGNKIKITVSSRGFGCENKGGVKMLRPTQGLKEIKEFVVKQVKDAGADPCPPIVLGVGIGGTMEKAALLSKQAILQPIDKHNPKQDIAKLEKELLNEVNRLNIGPMGLGGKTTVLGVRVLTYATHIAGLPVAVNISCHATRSATKII